MCEYPYLFSDNSPKNQTNASQQEQNSYTNFNSNSDNKRISNSTSFAKNQQSIYNL